MASYQSHVWEKFFSNPRAAHRIGKSLFSHQVR